METKLTKADVVNYLEKGIKSVGAWALNIYGESLNQAGEQAFSEAIEFGIKNTISALYDAKVNDKEICRVSANIGALVIRRQKIVLFGKSNKLRFAL